jgi:hypothetical protein
MFADLKETIVAIIYNIPEIPENSGCGIIKIDYFKIRISLRQLPEKPILINCVQDWNTVPYSHIDRERWCDNRQIIN